MADNSSRWERIADKPGERTVFSARQSTESFRQPEEERPHRSRRHGSRARTGRTWYVIGLVVLSLLAGILAWQLFAS